MVATFERNSANDFISLGPIKYPAGFVYIHDDRSKGNDVKKNLLCYIFSL